jgi:parvulin-like peptidyl-prolyl isomerase
LIYAAPSVARISAKGGKPAGLQRLALLGFAALFVLLFVIFAVAEGIGDPSVSSGDVAVVEDAPSGLSPITEARFKHALLQTSAQNQEKKLPKPGEEKYEELKKKTLEEMLNSIWIQGQAEEMGISVTPKEVLKELTKLKKRAFKTEKQYREFLKEAHFTKADVLERVKVQMLTEQIQEQIAEEASQPSKSEIETYYEAAKSTQLTTPESRDIRVVKNKDKGKVEAAKAALEKDDSIKSWEKVAKKYSTDTTKSNGGLQSGVSEETLGEPLGPAVFEAGQGEIEGPLSEGKTYVVFEVMKVTPEKVQSLDEAKSQISTQLAEQKKQQKFQRFVRDWNSRWTSRTFCASGYEVERCANFKGSGRPAEANPACYEANPKTPAEACPAPVTQVKPAMPGTVSPLNPEGNRLAQRPRPAGLEETPAAPEGELPPGVVPGATGE